MSYTCFWRQGEAPGAATGPGQSPRPAHLQPTPPLIAGRKVCLVRARIASGFYDRPEVVDAVVEALLGRSVLRRRTEESLSPWQSPAHDFQDLPSKNFRLGWGHGADLSHLRNP